MSDGTRFHILLFDGKMNISVWKSSMKDLLVQKGIDGAL